MLRPKNQEIRTVSGLTHKERALINAFIQGAVYCWAKNQKSPAEFAVRDLVGRENADWSGTPLQVLYEKHRNAGKDHDGAFSAAAIDLGWLVKAVLKRDRRKFVVTSTGWPNTYRWVG